MPAPKTAKPAKNAALIGLGGILVELVRFLVDYLGI